MDLFKKTNIKEIKAAFRNAYRTHGKLLCYDIGIIAFVSISIRVGSNVKYQQFLKFCNTFPWSLNRPDNNQNETGATEKPYKPWWFVHILQLNQYWNEKLWVWDRKMVVFQLFCRHFQHHLNYNAIIDLKWNSSRGKVL